MRLQKQSEKYILSLGSDKKLPQIGRMRDLLSRGIGVHHGGLLPLVKEVSYLLPLGMSLSFIIV